jgi:hypothetical protein
MVGTGEGGVLAATTLGLGATEGVTLGVVVTLLFPFPEELALGAAEGIVEGDADAEVEGSAELLDDGWADELDEGEADELLDGDGELDEQLEAGTALQPPCLAPPVAPPVLPPAIGAAAPLELG